MADDVLEDKLKKFQSFMKDVKQIEQRDGVLTSDKQVERLTKPGSKYLNLNPYEVLLITPDFDKDASKKQYRKLSILVHPDKNLENNDAAQKAFDAVKHAHEILQNPEEVKRIKLILDEAENAVKVKLKEKRKEVKKLCPTAVIPEDEDPQIFAKFKRAVTATLFADNEILKEELKERQQQEKKRELDAEAEEEGKAKKQKDFEKQWDETRTTRVDDWRSFQTNATNKAKKKKTFKSFKPPSLKPEAR